MRVVTTQTLCKMYVCYGYRALLFNFPAGFPCPSFSRRLRAARCPSPFAFPAIVARRRRQQITLTFAGGMLPTHFPVGIITNGIYCKLQIFYEAAPRRSKVSTRHSVLMSREIPRRFDHASPPKIPSKLASRSTRLFLSASAVCGRGSMSQRRKLGGCQNIRGLSIYQLRDIPSWASQYRAGT